MQMTLSYYLNKLRKDCFLKHHGRNGLESTARAHSIICRTVKTVQMIQSTKRFERFYSFPVAKMVEHGASNAKIMGSIPRESKS